MRFLRNAFRGATTDALLAANSTVGKAWIVTLLSSIPKPWEAIHALENAMLQQHSNQTDVPGAVGLVHINPHASGPPGGGEYMRPVSCTLQCVMLLNIVALLVYTALSIARNKDELDAVQKPSLSTQALTVAGRTAAYMPMLCMLFVGCRMYVLATTEGLGEPQDWVKGCMRMASFGVVLQIIVPLLFPVFMKPRPAEISVDDPAPTEAVEEVEEKGIPELAGDQTDVHPVVQTQDFDEEHEHMKPLLMGLQIMAVCMIYLGVGGVIVGIIMFPAQTTKISAAVLCTIALSVIYFLAYLALFIVRSSDAVEEQVNAALAMTSAVRKAPMCSVFFLVSRMRALQLNPPLGMPPAWMQGCFFLITACIYIETFAAATVGLSGKKVKAYYGVYLFHCESAAAHTVQHCSAMLGYLAFFPCVYGVYAMKDMAGVYGEVGAPGPLSTTMKCVLVFSAVYFGNAAAQSITLFFEDVLKKTGEYTVMIRDTIVASGISLSLAPMLSVLFVATRMRALQITQQRGAPPGWAQDCMLVAVFATLVQSTCCLVMPIFIGSASKVDDDGNPDYDLRPMIGAYAVTVVKYVSLIALYGSVITICVAVFIMTPETAHSGVRIINSPKALFEALGVTLLILCIALLFSSAKVIGMAVKFAVESCDQALLGVDITIKSAALSLFKGYVSINNLVLHQPEEEIKYTRDAEGKLQKEETGKKLEWDGDYIVKVRTIMVKINLWRLASSLGKEFELENLSICGIFANIEKPDTDLKASNSNVEYIINHIDHLGLIPPPEDPKAAAEKEKADKAEEAAKPKDEEKKEEPAQELDIPKIIIGKIQVGDIGAGVCIKNVPYFGQIKFRPSIGMIKFENVQQDIFGGREDLEPSETVACIITAITRKIVKTVVNDIPEQLKLKAKEAAHKTAEKAKAAMTSCTSGCFAAVTPKSMARGPKAEDSNAEAAASTSQPKAQDAGAEPVEDAKEEGAEASEPARDDAVKA